jgi:AcrR family transcriptional regulator
MREVVPACVGFTIPHVKGDLQAVGSVDPSTLGQIVAAARGCYAERGVAATRMQDVAGAAGISRQYLYRFVSGRGELLELAVLARLRELGTVLTAHATLHSDDVAEAIVEQVICGIELGRDDPEFTTLAAMMPRDRLNLILTSGSSPLNAITGDAFGALFAEALTQGRLRTDVSTDAMVEWLQGVQALFAGREDLDPTSQRTMIRNFVLPSLIR